MKFGIDFGTSNSVVAVWDAGRTEVLDLDAENLDADWYLPGFGALFPSVFGMSAERGRPMFGWAAKLRAPDAAYSVKRFLRDGGTVDVLGHTYQTSTVAAALFRAMREGARRRSGHRLDSAIVTVPANSTGRARYRTREAAFRGGVHVEALLNEPTAAAMAYVQNFPGDQRIAVFDWGGGTLDVTVLEYSDGLFEERASRGAQRLGGIDIDARLGRTILDKLDVDSQRWSKADHARFTRDVERTKIRLSLDAVVPFTSPDGTRVVEVLRSALEANIEPLIAQAITPLEDCLDDLRLTADDLDAVVMVGGSSQIPMIRERVADFLGTEAVSPRLIDPMTAVARGAAIASAVLSGELDSELAVVTANALGTGQSVSGNRLFSTIIPRNASLPTAREKNFTPLKDNARSARVEIWEGDPSLTLDSPDNVLLTDFSVPFPDPRPAEQSRFTLRYSYDTSGIVRVTLTLDRNGQVLLDQEVSSFGADAEHDLSGVDEAELAEIFQRTSTSSAAPAKVEGDTFIESNSVVADSEQPSRPQPASADRQRTAFIVDGSSLLTAAEAPSVEVLLSAIADLEGLISGASVHVLLSAAAVTTLDENDRKHVTDLHAQKQVLLIDTADAETEALLVVAAARQADAAVVSARDWSIAPAAASWLHQRGRLWSATLYDSFWEFEPRAPEVPSDVATRDSRELDAPDSWQDYQWTGHDRSFS